MPIAGAASVALEVILGTTTRRFEPLAETSPSIAKPLPLFVTLHVTVAPATPSVTSICAADASMLPTLSLCVLTMHMAALVLWNVSTHAPA